MNQVQFCSVDGKLTVSVDGNSLIELLAKFERPLAVQEGSPKIAGQYDWLPADKETKRSFLGGADDYYEKSILLGCDCGVASCWPLLARVSIESETIVWRDFEQPHRSEDSLKFWDYSDFGPFEFDLTKYTASLSAAMEKC